MFDSFTFRSNTQTNLSIRLDQDDSSASIEKLKSIHQQNFTSILNNPTQNYSFFEDIKNKIYHNIYDSSPTTEINDLEKFEIDSPKSQASGSKSSKHSLKDLMNESFTSYINRISKEFPQYKKNHYSKKQFVSGTDSSVVVVNNSVTNLSYFSRNNSCNVTVFYQPNSKIILKIPKEFLTNTQFKFSNDILEKKEENIQKYCRELIELCGEIDFEIEKILEHSLKLYNYINQNLQPLCDQLDLSLINIKEMKKSKKFIKEKFLMNTVSKIKKEIRKRNLIKSICIVKKIESLKDILNLLKVLSVNPSKFKVTGELIMKGGDVLNQIKQECKNSKYSFNVNNLKLTKYFEEEFAKFSNKSTENISQEFNNLIKEELENSISIGKNCMHTEKEILQNDSDKIDFAFYVK